MTKNKWNQWRNQYFQKEGKQDTEDLIKIASWLKEKYGDKIIVRREWYLRFSRYDYKLVDILEFVTREQCYDKNLQVRWPDIMVLDRQNGKLLFVIELDGWIHNVKLGKTWKRNADYEFAGIKLIIIDEETLKLNNIDWFTYLEKEIDKLNIDMLKVTV